LSHNQTTIRSRVALSGVGVHTGKPVSVALSPADTDTGILFHCVGTDGSDHEVRALVSEVAATDFATVLGDPTGRSVATVEHLMATVFALGIDNLSIDVEGPEVPILDGSATAFVEAIDQAGILSLPAKRRYIRVLKPVRIEAGASWAEFRPHAGTRFEIEIDFESAAIGRQFFAAEIDADLFRNEIARARTFGFMKDVERLWAAGYALGSSLENSVVIGDDNRVINMEGLRYPDEFVRHKALDAIGDLALAGAPLLCSYKSFKGGHRINHAVLSALLADPTAWTIVEAKVEVRAPRPRGHADVTAGLIAPAYGADVS
jgi:UDP-3-O-[3-hydroxymyristoyl] N-acetylglucosamine deacetylase